MKHEKRGYCETQIQIHPWSFEREFFQKKKTSLALTYWGHVDMVGYCFTGSAYHIYKLYYPEREIGF